MKSKLSLILTLVSLWLCQMPAMSQEEKTQQGIVEHLIEASDSTLTIDMPPTLLKELSMPTQKTDGDNVNTSHKHRTPQVSSNKNKSAARTNGFRIQIFSDGRNQNTLQARARARASKVLSRFPKYNHQVYSFSKSPNYYTRIGNFSTRAEANAALAQLRRAFPDFANEMRVVPCEVILMK